MASKLKFEYLRARTFRKKGIRVCEPCHSVSTSVLRQESQQTHVDDVGSSYIPSIRFLEHLDRMRKYLRDVVLIVQIPAESQPPSLHALSVTLGELIEQTLKGPRRSSSLSRSRLASITFAEGFKQYSSAKKRALEAADWRVKRLEFIVNSSQLAWSFVLGGGPISELTCLRGETGGRAGREGERELAMGCEERRTSWRESCEGRVLAARCQGAQGRQCSRRRLKSGLVRHTYVSSFRRFLNKSGGGRFPNNVRLGVWSRSPSTRLLKFLNPRRLIASTRQPSRLYPSTPPPGYSPWPTTPTRISTTRTLRPSQSPFS